MKDNLLIITRIKKTIEYAYKHLENYPKKYIELKKNIIGSLFSILEFCYLANDGYDVNKNKAYVIVKITMVDYYFKLSYKNDLITKKRYEMLSRHLLEINKMINAWKRNDEKKE